MWEKHFSGRCSHSGKPLQPGRWKGPKIAEALGKTCRELALLRPDSIDTLVADSENPHPADFISITQDERGAVMSNNIERWEVAVTPVLRGRDGQPSSCTVGWEVGKK